MGDFGPTYHKINSAFKRDLQGHVIPHEWSTPEFEYLRNTPWDWTEKVDGSNLRLFYDGKKVTLGGRTDRAQLNVNLIEAIRGMGLLEPDVWAPRFPGHGHEMPETGVTLFGEGYGAGIQKGGGLYREDPGFILFDVRVGHTFLRRNAVEQIADAFNVPVVPFVGTCSPLTAWSLIRQGELKSDWAERGVQMEGIVGTPQVPMYDRMGRRIVMKMKYQDWHEIRAVAE
jgi:hypothetical protein